MRINFLRSADAFLYLPVYIAKDLEIYKEINSDLDINFDSPVPNGGDFFALKEMVSESLAGDVIPIAVCDPFAAFSGHTTLGIELKNLRVLGAFITRVPFWAVDGPNTKFVDKEEELKSFNKLIFYNDLLETGNYIGKQTKALTGISNIKPVDFGEEFSELYSEEKQGRAVAITCDILGMTIHKKCSQLNVVHSYARNATYKDFITTALVTTADICNEYPQEIISVLQGMQNSLAILRASKKVAFSICNDLAENESLYQEHHKINGVRPKLGNEEIQNMVNWIYDGNFYPETLDISRQQWISTIDCHEKSFPFCPEVFEEGRNLYDTIVVNEPLLEAQKRFMIKVGINISDLLDREFEAERKRIALLEQNALELVKNHSIENKEKPADEVFTLENIIPLFENILNSKTEKIHTLKGDVRSLESGLFSKRHILENRIRLLSKISNGIHWFFKLAFLAGIFAIVWFLIKDPIADNWSYLEPYVWLFGLLVSFAVWTLGVQVRKHFHIHPFISNFILKFLLKSKIIFADLGKLDDDIIDRIIAMPHEERKTISAESLFNSRDDENTGK